MSDSKSTSKRKSTRKDRVLNTRISEDLDEQLRQQAEKMNMPVSQLVRRILTRTVDMVGNISGNVEYLVHEAIEDVVSIADATRPEDRRKKLRESDKLEGVVGWQPMRAHRRFRCALTGTVIESGEDAYISVRTDGKEQIVISAETFDELLSPSPAGEWVQLVVTQDVESARSGEVIEKGEQAWVRVGSNPPEIITQAEYEAGD